MTFSDKIVEQTVDRLINGDDYRESIINDINAQFLDFALIFFKRIIDAKMNDTSITLEWYTNTFINTTAYSSDEIAIFAGINRKTITNIAGNAKKETIIEFSNANFTYLSNMINNLEQDMEEQIDIIITLSYKDISVKLNLTESLLVINALATKKIAIRGSAWSAIGKTVEKPLVDKLCELVKIDIKYIDNKHFIKNKNKDFDREVDYKLISRDNRIYRVEVKLMGKGNPESADAIHARDTDIFIADTLSEQNKNQFKANNIQFIELKGSTKDKILADFRSILDILNIPYNN